MIVSEISLKRNSNPYPGILLVNVNGVLNVYLQFIHEREIIKFFQFICLLNFGKMSSFHIP